MQAVLEAAWFAGGPTTPLQGGTQPKLCRGQLPTVSETVPKPEQPEDPHVDPLRSETIQVIMLGFDLMYEA